ncbi:MAG: hypothetical protein K5894_16355 [Lachnospiraceae bacterium]|nr:hypothetical protein [Lachnospiraceae bacterium]
MEGEYISKREVMKFLQVTQALWIATCGERKGAEAITKMLSLLIKWVDDLEGVRLDEHRYQDFRGV